MAVKKLLKNIAAVGFIQLANYVFPMISIPIISRIIGPDKLGAINFTASFIAYFILIISFGFDLTATRRVARDPFNDTNRNKVFSEVFSAKCLLLVISILVFLPCVQVIPQLQMEKELALFTFLICFSTVMNQNWLFQAMQDLPKVAVLTLIGKIIFTIFVIVLVKQKEDYLLQPLILSLSQIIAAFLSLIWAIRKYQIKIYLVRFNDCLRLLWEEKIFFFSLCIISVYTNTNIIMLGLMKGTTDVGFYTAGQKLISIIQMIITIPLSQAIFPYISGAFAEDRAKGLHVVQRLLPLVFMLTLFAALAIMVGAPYFIRLFYGKAFLSAIVVCRILAFIPMIIALGTVLGVHVMLNLNLDKQFLQVTLSGAVFSLLLNYFLVSKYGYIGAAYTWTMTELFNLILLFLILQRRKIEFINIYYFQSILNRKTYGNFLTQLKKR